VFSRPGLCSHCHEWLGVPPRHREIGLTAR
jgi:hypothetical protein